MMTPGCVFRVLDAAAPSEPGRWGGSKSIEDNAAPSTSSLRDARASS